MGSKVQNASQFNCSTMNTMLHNLLLTLLLSLVINCSIGYGFRLPSVVRLARIQSRPATHRNARLAISQGIFTNSLFQPRKSKYLPILLASEDDDIFDEDDGNVNPESDDAEADGLDEDIFDEVSAESAIDELEAEKVLRENWDLICDDNEVPSEQWAHVLDAISQDKVSDEELALGNISVEGEYEDYEEDVDLGDMSNANVYALIYKIKDNLMGSPALEAMMEKHDDFSKSFDRLLSSEMLDVGVMKGVVTLWGGLEGENQLTLSDIKQYIDSDPLVAEGYVEQNEIIPLSNLLGDGDTKETK